MDIQSESNRLKNLSGDALQVFLENTFKEMVDKSIILNFQKNVNYNHKGYSYPRQYLVNFLLETLDNKYIIINSSTSFRNDRFKGQAYDIEGVLKHSYISSDVIAAIALYPDSELEDNQTFINFRQRVKDGITYSPTTYLLTVSELYSFLENHSASIETDETVDTETDIVEKDGSYFGKRGNKLEKEIVKILNNTTNLKSYKSNTSAEPLFNKIINQICAGNVDKENIIAIQATDTIPKLLSGGNAKTDIIIAIVTTEGTCTETISVKCTNKTVVSCHDYKVSDYIRVLDIENTKLADYFKLFQAYPSYEAFEANLPAGYSKSEFEELLNPYKVKLTEWALTGKHDIGNLIEPAKQVSNYLLIVTDTTEVCVDYPSYIKKISEQAKLNYGIPFSWTYPSKQRGLRIQFKMPIIL
ncbi:MAG: hypothetical protein CJD30_03905 [Sulfuricurvum sp. PD_MW2]|uniref:MspI family type II restriction endonuclease n=1 Tax=Sulfuricurvum sp. PD_MW2 TaxID=2027917 RepID=UPI000C060D4E|nr:MspI family type II restriction endonuclease [Sulfuricurvum sp. PD_MW2]PHM17914.1 MAG: hypothetical protein CJD30_03905 [Sulfuricurvum sp. PD_MW2]